VNGRLSGTSCGFMNSTAPAIRSLKGLSGWWPEPIHPFIAYIGKWRKEDGCAL